MANASDRATSETERKPKISIETGLRNKPRDDINEGIHQAKRYDSLIKANLISSKPSGHIKLIGTVTREGGDGSQDDSDWIFKGKWSYIAEKPQELDFCYRPSTSTPSSTPTHKKEAIGENTSGEGDISGPPFAPSGKWNGSFSLGNDTRSSNKVPEVLTIATEKVAEDDVMCGDDESIAGKIAYISKTGKFVFCKAGTGQELVELQGEGSNRYGDFVINGRYNANNGEFVGIKTYLLRRRNRNFVEGGEIRHSKRQRMPNRMLQGYGSLTSPNGSALSDQRDGNEAQQEPQQQINAPEVATSTKGAKLSKGKQTTVKVESVAQVDKGTGTKTNDDKRDGVTGTDIGAANPENKKRKAKPGMSIKLPQKGKRIRGVGCEWSKATVDAQGEVYEGSFLNGERHGYGTCGFPSGELYEGDWLDGREHGRGVLFDMNGSLLYQGEFQDGRINGKGTYFYANGDRYDGEWRDGMRHGYGVYRSADGAVFEGDWVRNKRHGQGLAIGADGSTYEGEWANDVRCGRGYLRLASGLTFDGTFKDNMMDGRGVCTYQDQSRYEGVWREGKKNGRGTYIFTNGATYEGRFKDDQVHGTGTLKMKKGVPVRISPSAWVLPIDCQHELRYVHLRAGFGVDGK